MSKNSSHAKRLAQNLIEILAPYEEELIDLERETPALASLRRAVGIVVAEACYCITDDSTPAEGWAPPADDEANQTS